MIEPRLTAAPGSSRLLSGSGNQRASAIGRGFRSATVTNQARQHSLDFVYLAEEGFGGVAASEPEIPSREHMRLEFASRAQGEVKQPDLVSNSVPATALGDVCRHGNCGTPHLRDEILRFRSREGRGELVHRQRHFVPALPYL